MGQSKFMPRSVSEPSVAVSAMRTCPAGFGQLPASSTRDTGSEAGDDDNSPRSIGGKSVHGEINRGINQPTEPKPKKRVLNGKLHGKTSGGYMLLKGAHALNQVEERLLEAGIDVRGHYHKLGRDRPSV